MPQNEQSAQLFVASCYVIDLNGLDPGGVGQSLVVDPSGRVVYGAGQTTDMFPITIDLGLVREVRIRGADGLGQVLKSFRDRSIKFDTYEAENESDYLISLGVLKSMRRYFYLLGRILNRLNKIGQIGRDFVSSRQCRIGCQVSIERCRLWLAVAK